MDRKKVKLILGFITYGKTTAKYLPYFLESLRGQAPVGHAVIAVDNSDEKKNPNQSFIKRNYPEISLEWLGGNSGFSRANNLIIKKAKTYHPDFIMFLNPDTILEAGCVSRLVAAMEKNGSLGSASAKIKVWDFENKKKTDIIDSCGLVARPGLRMVDLGQGRRDRGQFDNASILGPSGTAPIYRLSALEKIKMEDDYFDENMFMYKEDCDLAYRLFLAGYRSKLVKDALIFHHRSVSARGESAWQIFLNRKNKSRRIKKWSFLNQHIIFLRYWRLESLKNKASIFFQAVKMFVYALFFEPYLLKEYFRLINLKIKPYKK